MLILIGTKPDFGISQKWILQRAGIGESSYINARKALVKRGWLYHSDGESIKINFDAIREDGKKMDAERAKKNNTEKPATIAGESKPATTTGKDIPASIAGNEECGRKPATIAGKAPATIEGNTPATIADIINKEQSKIEHNNIIEKPQAQEAKGQARKEVSESSLISLLNGGNKVVWEDKEQGLFSYNGRQFKVIWNQQAIAETPATTSGNAEKGRIPLKRPEMPF